MSHEVLFEDLVDYVEGRLAPDAAARLEAHVAGGCAECAAGMAWLQRTLGLMASDRLVDAPVHTVRRAVELYRPPRRWPFAHLAGLLRSAYRPGLRPAITVALTVLLLAGSIWGWGNIQVAQAATLTRVDGPVEVRFPGSTAWQPAVPGQMLTAGCALRAGAGAEAVVQYADGSHTALGEGAEVEILALSGRRAGHATTVRLGQAAGHTEHEVASAESSLQVEAEGAAAQASAAAYDVWVRDGEMDVAARRGQVTLQSGREKTRVPAGGHGRAGKGHVPTVASEPTPAPTGAPTPEPPAATPTVSSPEPTKPGNGHKPTPIPELEPTRDHLPPGQANPGSGKPKETKAPRPTPSQAGGKDKDKE